MKTKVAVLIMGVALLFLVFKAGSSLEAMSFHQELSVHHPVANVR